MSDEATTDGRRPSELDLLRDEMRAGFQEMRDRFDGVDKRFEGVDQRFDAVDQRFDAVDKRFDGMDKRFDGVDRRFDGTDKRLESSDQRLDGLDTQMGGLNGRLDEHDKRFVSLETRITEESATTRRHFDVVAESLRADMKVVIDKTTTTGRKLDRLITRNAIEHAAIRCRYGPRGAHHVARERRRRGRLPIHVEGRVRSPS